MKTDIKIPILFSIIICLMHSCQREINLTSQFEEQKQVVNCLFENGKNFYVYTSLTGTPTDTNLLGTNANSVVILYENNLQKEILPYSSNSAVYQSNTVAKIGNTYKLEVRDTRYQPSDKHYMVTASTTLPDSIGLINPYFKDSVMQDAFGNWMGKIHFEVADKNGMVNPELVIEYYDPQKSDYSPISNFIPDNNWKKHASASISSGTYTINNSDWNGATVAFDLFVSSIDYNASGLTQFRLSLSNLSTDWRNYQTSLAAYLKASGSDDQLKVHSNILGEGYGIFAGKSISRVVVK
ncbi:MAG: hypothetical protein SGJ10_13815 [Bacteroidota bacterium]|nr:hypothetical protein [Bacteroidota bacterium]